MTSYESSPQIPNIHPPAGALVPMGPASVGGESVHIGDIMVTREWLTSPQGRMPAHGARIDVVNRTQVTTGIPTWAVVLAIVGFFILTIFSLFFLLAKEQRLAGGYEVIATGPGGTLTSFVPVNAQNSSFIWNDLQYRAEQARRLLASTPA